MFLTLLFLIAGLSPAQAEIVGRYVLTLPEVHSSHAEVTARIRVEDGRLAAGFGGAFDWARGWADFVVDLEVRAADGRAIEVGTAGEHDDFAWTLTESGADGVPFTGDVDVAYRVDLGYAHRAWSFGNEQAGLILDGALYTVTKGLFVGAEVEGVRQVTFDVPDDWRVAVPWTPLEGRTYHVPDLLALQNNALLLGDFASFEHEAEGFRFTLALPGAMGESRELIQGAMDRVLPLYLRLFPETERTPYLMTVYYAEQEDGEAFANASTFTTTQPVEESTSLLWAGFLAHELFHFWNGQQLRGTPRHERQWFSEGFTEYYANLACANGGVLDEAELVKKMEAHLANYLYFMQAPAFDGVTLRAAGKQKGRHRLGVYSGGWATAFVLDQRLHATSGGERCLDDLMRALFEHHARPAEPYTFEDLIANLMDVGGPELEGFLETYVDGREVLPVQETLAAYGWLGLAKPYAGEFYVVPDERATAEERAAWRWLTRERFD